MLVRILHVAIMLAAFSLLALGALDYFCRPNGRGVTVAQPNRATWSSDEVTASLPRDPCTRLAVLGTSFVVVLLGLGAPCAFSGEANSLQRRFLEEAPSAWEAYDRFWL